MENNIPRHVWIITVDGAPMARVHAETDDDRTRMEGRAKIKARTFSRANPGAQVHIVHEDTRQQDDA